jgi:hypothetical protein
MIMFFHFITFNFKLRILRVCVNDLVLVALPAQVLQSAIEAGHAAGLEARLSARASFWLGRVMWAQGGEWRSKREHALARVSSPTISLSYMNQASKHPSQL